MITRAIVFGFLGGVGGSLIMRGLLHEQPLLSLIGVVVLAFTAAVIWLEAL